MTLSLVLIVKNEEKNLERVLDSIKDVVDEIIVVDIGSEDNSKVIANRFGVKLFDFTWNDDFSAARNFGIEQATSDWILMLEADEMVDPADFKHFKTLMKKEAECIALSMKKFTDDKTQYGFVNKKTQTLFGKEYAGFIINDTIRLFKNKSYIRYVGPVHEYVNISVEELKGKIARADVVIQHELKVGPEHDEKQLKTLKIYEENVDKYPNKARAYQELGLLYMNHKKDYVKAIKLLKKSLEYDKKNERSWLALGMSSLAIEDHFEAGKAFAEHLKLNPKNTKVIILFGRACEMCGDYERAIKLNEALIKLGFPEALIRKKIEHLQKQKDDEGKYKLNVKLG